MRKIFCISGIILLMVSISMIFGGCGGDSQPNPEGPTSTPIIAYTPNPTSRFTPTLAPSPTSRPTSTQAPTVTTTPAPTPTPTFRSTPTASVSTTPTRQNTPTATAALTPTLTSTPTPKREMDPDGATIALWHFNELSGQGVYDSSGHNLHLYLGDDNTMESNIEPARITSGRNGFGYCLSFDAGKWQRVTHEPNSGFGVIRSIEFWVKASPVGEEGIIALFGSLVVKHSALGEIYFGFRDVSSPPGMVRYCSSYGEIDDGKWHYVACTFSETDKNSKIYLDGIFIAGKVFSTAVLQTDGPFCYLGGYPGSTWFNGFLEEVRVSDCVRTSAEILDYYNRVKDTIRIVKDQPSKLIQGK